MGRQTKIVIIKKAWSYKSGEDTCNSVYLGSMEKASILRKLGATYGGDIPFNKLLVHASNHQIDKVYNALSRTIKYMNDHPVTKCECCGGIK